METVRIASDVRLGRDVKLYAFVNLYGCTIGDDCKIGTFVEIQKGVTVGQRVKISSHSFLCEGVTVEDDVFIGHGVILSMTDIQEPPRRGECCKQRMIGRWYRQLLNVVPQ